MEYKDFKTIARQLRKPHGALGKETGAMMNKGNKLMNLAAIEQLEINANDNILEIGMGNGYFVKHVLANDKTIRYDGCDFSEIMVEDAIISNKDYVENGQARFTPANANNLPYINEHFNKVFTVNTIYFWDKIEEVLSEIRRVLKKDGLLIISLRPKSVMDNIPVTKYGFKTFSKIDCIELLTKHGFEIINVIEEEDLDIELFGEKFRNAFMIVKAIKNNMPVCPLFVK
ncbi:MAG TPA: class I SAM-dependent methyltransferase [Chitinophagaceae bacterium]|nr:class I SAM-dependent methyltransferase [Chitinophagaceae bacterium]